MDDRGSLLWPIAQFICCSIFPAQGQLQSFNSVFCYHGIHLCSHGALRSSSCCSVSCPLFGFAFGSSCWCSGGSICSSPRGDMSASSEAPHGLAKWCMMAYALHFRFQAEACAQPSHLLNHSGSAPPRLSRFSALASTSPVTSFRRMALACRSARESLPDMETHPFLKAQGCV